MLHGSATVSDCEVLPDAMVECHSMTILMAAMSTDVASVAGQQWSVDLRVH